MHWPWNVRVREVRGCFCAETRIKGVWLDSGSAPTWLEAFLMGLVA